MSFRALGTVLAFSTLACVAPVELVLPAEPELAGARSLIFIWDDLGGHSGGFAADTTRAEAIGLSLRTTDTLTVVAYTLELAEMGLEHGPIPPVSISSRPLPEGYTAFRAGPRLDGERTWMRVDDPLIDAALSRFRIPGFPPGTCEERSGCFRRTGEEEWCALPCMIPQAPAPPAEPQQPARPNPAARPMLLPCPPGWSVVPPAGIDHVSSCAPPSALGPPCPIGQWPDPATLPVGLPISYVDPAAPAGGTGSPASPFARIRDALSAGAGETVIALSKGRFEEDIVLTSSVALIGACAEGTEATIIGGSIWARAGEIEIANLRIDRRLRSEAALRVEGPRASILTSAVVVTNTRRDLPAVIVFSARRVALHDLALRDTGPGIWIEAAGIPIELKRVSIDEFLSSGIAIRRGARAVLEDISVRDGNNTGLEVIESGVQVSRFFGARLRHRGISVKVASTATISDVVVEDLADGIGFELLASATARVERLLIHRAGRFGVLAAGSSELRDLEITETQLFREMESGEGLVIDGARVVVERARIARNFSSGIAVIASNAPASALLIDLEVSGTKAHIADTDPGSGLELRDDVAVDVERALFEDNEMNAIRMLQVPRTAGPSNFRDLTILGGLSEGIYAAGNGNRSLIERALISGTAKDGILVDGAQLTARDLTILSPAGDGLSWIGGVIGAARVRIEDTEQSGLRGDPGSTTPQVMLEDVTVVASKRFGAKIKESMGMIQRSMFERNVANGVCVHASSMQLLDLHIRDTRDPMMEIDHCAEPQGRTRRGAGLHVRGRTDFGAVITAQTTVRRFLITDNSERGVDIGPVATVDLHQGIIEGHATGVEIKNNMPENQRYEDQVIYRRNAVNVHLFPTAPQ